jgi:hypothetical protein
MQRCHGPGTRRAPVDDPCRWRDPGRHRRPFRPSSTEPVAWPSSGLNVPRASAAGALSDPVGVNWATLLVELPPHRPRRTSASTGAGPSPRSPTTCGSHTAPPLVARSRRGRHVVHQRSGTYQIQGGTSWGGGRDVKRGHLGIWPLSAGYQIHPFSRAIRYAAARDPASSLCGGRADVPCPASPTTGTLAGGHRFSSSK